MQTWDLLSCFPTENELSWDTSDWDSGWDNEENKEEDSASSTKVCVFFVSILLLCIWVQNVQKKLRYKGSKC